MRNDETLRKRTAYALSEWKIVLDVAREYGVLEGIRYFLYLIRVPDWNSPEAVNN